MKTVMQEAIELVKKYDNREIPFNVMLFNLELLLEKEKEQIMKAFYADDDTGKCKYEDCEDYYNQTYNQNKLFTYCQREIEGQSICDKQCEHCKEYYAPLENQNK